MAYTVALLAHGWIRWVVLGLALTALVRAMNAWMVRRGWESGDERIAKLFLASVDTQLLLGLVLYVISPIVSAGRANMAAAMHDRTLRFFTVEHISMMLVAVVIAHVGRVRAKKLGDKPERHRTTLWTVGVFLLLVLASIPWPFLPHGRPLFRVGV